MQKLSNEKIVEILSVKDLTNPLNGSHFIQLVMNKILKNLKMKWISPEQKNLLIRITLKSLSKTLTTDESKHIRNNIYNFIHKGNKKEEDYLW